ncbi:hypothetical protein [Nocardioides nanhaiensis]|uniref:Uncharacterized protein n=1 Tax=Nocardioides nanhaiensis TaxID=1476871 RepID=A0ABP8W1G2_9ACTN
MAWEEQLFALFEDLEQQAEALADAARAPDLLDRGRAEYQQVSLASRLVASLELPLLLEVEGVGPLRGRLERVGTGWCLLSGDGGSAQDWIVSLAAVTGATGVSERSVPEVAWSPLTRLTLGSALRRLAEAGERCVLHRRDGSRLEGVLRRVGADFAELREPSGRLVLVAFAAIAAAQGEDA